MASGDPYATLALLKTRLGILDTNDDAALTNALGAASRDIEGWCGRQFNDYGTESARIYYPDDLVTVSVDDFQSSAGFALAVDFSNSGTYGTTITSSNYQLEPLNGVVDGTAGWPFYRIHMIQTWAPIWYATIGYPRASIQVTGRWGWAAVPNGITEACLMLAEETFKLKDAPYGVQGGLGPTRIQDNPKVENLLERYIRSPILVA
jgi:hypothetical protein